MVDHEEFSGQKIRIYPLTRIQGRADIEVHFTPNQEVAEARFRALETRGFARLVVGMHAFRAPALLSRVCGSCGVFHQLASCIAIEEATSCEVPHAAQAYRELVALLSLASSHLSVMTFLSLPDYALPMSDAAVRNVVGLYKIEQEAISRLTSVHSAFLEALTSIAGRATHPAVIVPGGVSAIASSDTLEKAAGLLRGCEDDMRETLRLSEMLVKRDAKMMDAGRPMGGYYLAVTSEDHPALLGDRVSIGSFTSDEQVKLDPVRFVDALEYRPVPWSYLVPVSVAGLEPALVGPLARVDLGFGPDTPWAELESGRAFEQWGRPLDREFLSFIALNLEVIWAWELALKILEGPDSLVGEPASKPELARGEGTAVVDSPSGVIAHTVSIGDDGNVEEYGITSPLQFNHLLINECLSRVASDVVGSLDMSEVVTQRLQLVVRSFNPCVPCGTH